MIRNIWLTKDGYNCTEQDAMYLLYLSIHEPNIQETYVNLILYPQTMTSERIFLCCIHKTKNDTIEHMSGEYSFYRDYKVLDTFTLYTKIEALNVCDRLKDKYKKYVNKYIFEVKV